MIHYGQVFVIYGTQGAGYSKHTEEESMYGDIKIFCGSAHPALARDICAELGIPLSPSKTIKFSNENMLVQIEDSVREADVFVIQPSCEPVSDGIVELLITVDALKHASAGRITAVVPYFPYARSDKKDRPRISITARLMADLLETAGANRILTMDLHSPQIQGFSRIPMDQLRAVGIICEHLRSQGHHEDYVLVAADAGHAKELGAFANRLNLPMAIVDKRRDGDNEKPRAVNIIGDVRGKTALIVDDEIASGGTLIEGANFLLDKHGVNAVEAVATHGVLCGTAVSRLLESRITRVAVTDTVPVPEVKRFPRLTVLPTAPLFARAIRAIHEGTSVSALFNGAK